MFSTCLFCHTRLGSNEVVEHFPVGTRLAFDSERGRLWAVCPECRRWNLSPLDERWDAIDECERLFRSTRARVSTDNIGLAALPSGVDLIRIGRPLRPEFAAWRYGSQLQWRRRRVGIAAGIVGVAGLGAAAVAVPPLFAAAAPFVAMGYTAPLWVVPGMIAVDVADHFQWERVAVRVPSPNGRKLVVRVKHLWESAYYTDQSSDDIALRLVHDGGATRYEGEKALRAGSKLLARANWLGGAARLVQRAVQQIDETGDADSFLHKTASRFSRFHGRRMMARYRRIGAMSLVPVERLALEMAVHEESERRALQGELAQLAQEWKEAEEIAAIADDLLPAPRTRSLLDERDPDADPTS